MELVSVLPPDAIASKAPGGTARWAGSMTTRTAAKARSYEAASLATRCDFHVHGYRPSESVQFLFIRRIRNDRVDADYRAVAGVWDQLGQLAQPERIGRA